VVDPMDAPLPHDGRTVGEVVMRTPWLTASYVKDPERSAELWRSGWLHSGDVGFIGPDAYLQITDRIKDVIRAAGSGSPRSTWKTSSASTRPSSRRRPSASGTKSGASGRCSTSS